jgi:RNA recognition motif-containing protein
MKLYVGNIGDALTEIDLRALFTPHGSVLKVNVIRDHYTRQSKCFGYVQMADNKEGLSAMKALQGTLVNDNSLIVKEARSRDERDGHPY